MEEEKRIPGSLNARLCELLRAFHTEPTDENSTLVLRELYESEAFAMIGAERYLELDGEPLTAKDLRPEKVGSRHDHSILGVHAALLFDMDEEAGFYQASGHMRARVRTSHLLQICKEAGVAVVIFELGNPLETVLFRKSRDLRFNLMDPVVWRAAKRHKEPPPMNSRAERAERARKARGAQD